MLVGKNQYVILNISSSFIIPQIDLLFIITELCSLMAQWAKILPAMQETGSIPRSGKSPGEHGTPLQFSCLENPHRQRSLVGQESDTTEYNHGKAMLSFQLG